MKLNIGSLLVMGFLIVGLAAGVGILQLRQLVNTPKANINTATVLFDVNNFDVRVILDPQNNPISFAKIELNFDKNAVLVKEIGYTNLLGVVIATTSATTANNTGIISFTLGLIPADRNNPPSTAFDFLTLKFAPQNTAGSNSQLTLNPANSQVVNMANQQMSINSTPANIIVRGEPNNCGGTCGSHANCKAGLFCSNGYCRNPQCPSQTNCSCVTYTSNPTPTPTIKPKPTPEIVNYQLPTPTPTTSVYVAPEPSVEPVVSIWTRIVRFTLRLFGIKY